MQFVLGGVCAWCWFVLFCLGLYLGLLVDWWFLFCSYWLVSLLVGWLVIIVRFVFYVITWLLWFLCWFGCLGCGMVMFVFVGFAVGLLGLDLRLVLCCLVWFGVFDFGCFGLVWFCVDDWLVVVWFWCLWVQCL